MTGDRVRVAAIIFSWFTVAIEFMVALCYLVPQRFRIARWSHWALGLFIVAIYPVTPVVGFALTLLVLSIGAAQFDRRWTMIAIPLFVILPIFKEFEDVFALFG